MERKINKKKIPIYGLKNPVVVLKEDHHTATKRHVAEIYEYKKGKLIPWDGLMLTIPLEEIQEEMKEYPNLKFFPRGADDDKNIVGVWA